MLVCNRKFPSSYFTHVWRFYSHLLAIASLLEMKIYLCNGIKLSFWVDMSKPYALAHFTFQQSRKGNSNQSCDINSGCSTFVASIVYALRFHQSKLTQNIRKFIFPTMEINGPVVKPVLQTHKATFWIHTV